MSIFAASAYVSLCIGDYNVALEHANNLLSMDNLPGAYTLLGKLYAAESLISLDKINEAINYLRPDALSDLDISVPIPEALDKDEKRNEEIDKKPIKGVSTLYCNILIDLIKDIKTKILNYFLKSFTKSLFLQFG